MLKAKSEYSAPVSPSLLFLPGAGADPDFWRPVANLLPQGWQKWVCAWPGLGHNAPSQDVNGFDDLVRLVERRLPEDGVTLVAHSFGAAVAIDVALQLRHKVRALVLSATSAGLNVTKFGALDWRLDYRREYPSAASWLYTARPSFDTRLSELTPPTLLLWGDDDPISPVGIGQYLEQVLPNATLHVIAGGTHAFPVEHAQAVARLIHAHVVETFPTACAPD